jgi:hypothetical protein
MGRTIPRENGKSRIDTELDFAIAHCKQYTDPGPIMDETEKLLEETYFRHICRNCNSDRIGDNSCGDYVCFSCGRTHSSTVLDASPEWWQLWNKTYQRVFYFNERCSRWVCDEPKIDSDAWEIIHASAISYIKANSITRITREVISKVLKSVRLSKEFCEKHKSQKFKKTLMSTKRFYDKYSEKWKTITWKLTGVRPRFPPMELVTLIKNLFAERQRPFETYRHAADCDHRVNCDRYFDCWHNFINYDFMFRKFLQIAEIKFGWHGAFETYKEEFPLVSKKIRDKKLRPLFAKICEYNNWTCPQDE